jgi:hypothetical protein
MKRVPIIVVALAMVCLPAGAVHAYGPYVDNGDGTVTDTDTGLVWQQADDGVERNWEDACQYCQDLVFGGYEDWRTPRIDELRTILDYSRDNPAIDPVFECRSRPYWSGKYLRKPPGPRVARVFSARRRGNDQ